MDELSTHNENAKPPRQDSREWFWPAALAATIFLASSRSQVAAPDVPGIDKIAHFFVYGLFGTLLARVSTVARLRPLGMYTAVVLASIFGISDEFHQSFTPGRSVELADWLMDTGGAALAVLVYGRWRHYRSWLEFPLSRRSQVEIPVETAPDSAP
jgi:VanZ family protein